MFILSFLQKWFWLNMVKARAVVTFKTFATFVTLACMPHLPKVFNYCTDPPPPGPKPPAQTQNYMREGYIRIKYNGKKSGWPVSFMISLIIRSLDITESWPKHITILWNNTYEKYNISCYDTNNVYITQIIKCQSNVKKKEKYRKM